MLEIFRTRDTVVFTKGPSYAVRASPALIQNGWRGGQGLAWIDNGAEFTVTFADGGRSSGFALWGSDEDSDQFISMVENQPTYGYVVLCSGSWIFSTRTYEIYTYSSRIVPPLVPIAYQPGQKLFWSLRGFWTIEDEWTLSGDIRAPNEDPSGFVAQVPSPIINNYLTVQTTI